MQIALLVMLKMLKEATFYMRRRDLMHLASVRQNILLVYTMHLIYPEFKAGSNKPIYKSSKEG